MWRNGWVPTGLSRSAARQKSRTNLNGSESVVARTSPALPSNMTITVASPRTVSSRSSLMCPSFIAAARGAPSWSPPRRTRTSPPRCST